MLARKFTALAVTSLVTLMSCATTAWADGPSGGTNCPPDALDCSVHVQTPGSPGSGNTQQRSSNSGGSGSSACVLRPPSGDGPPQAVPCYRPGVGYFNPSDSCYWEKATPQPPASDPSWNGHKPGDGAIYNVTCTFNGGQVAGGYTWSANPPPGMGGGVNIAQLAQQAMSSLRLLGPDIGIAPDPNGKGGTVGVPVWMWNKPSMQTTGPASASATAGGVTVTATATVQHVDWSMGDGHTVICNGPGTPYSASDGMAKSPDCGYLYTVTSADQPGGKYQITATTTWAIHWVGGGQQGDLTTTRTSQVQISVGELQVVGG